MKSFSRHAAPLSLSLALDTADSTAIARTIMATLLSVAILHFVENLSVDEAIQEDGGCRRRVSKMNLG